MQNLRNANTHGIIATRALSLVLLLSLTGTHTHTHTLMHMCAHEWKENWTLIWQTKKFQL